MYRPDILLILNPTGLNSVSGIRHAGYPAGYSTGYPVSWWNFDKIPGIRLISIEGSGQNRISVLAPRPSVWPI